MTTSGSCQGPHNYRELLTAGGRVTLDSRPRSPAAGDVRRSMQGQLMRMRLRATVLPMSCVGAAACASAVPRGTRPHPTDLDYAVYEAALAFGPHAPSYLVIRTPARGDWPLCEAAISTFASRASNAYTDFKHQHGQDADLQPAFRLSYEYRLEPEVATPSPQFESLSSDDSVSRHSATFSRVGFSPSGNTAVTCLSYGCGPTCGSVQGFLLTKTTGIWSVDDVAIVAWF